MNNKIVNNKLSNQQLNQQLTIHLISDLHIDFRMVNLPEKGKKLGDVLLIAGDTCESKFLRHPSAHEFCEGIASNYDAVYIIKGNHDAWFSDMTTVDDIQREFYAQYGITYLENDLVDLSDDLQLFGATLWTDYCKADPNLMQMNDVMNDNRLIEWNGIECTNDIFYDYHRASVSALKQALDNGKGTVVMTHHAPCFTMLDNVRYPSGIMDYFYASNLYEMIYDYQNIKLWVSGHTHARRHHVHGNSLGKPVHLVSNCRGYRNENFDHDDFESMVFDVSMMAQE